MAKTNIANKYHTKKNSTKQRGITFDLTLEQFKVYWSLPTGVCAYTGMPFSGSGTSPNAPSLERIDKHKGYSVDNCCMVTVRANQLKDVIVDENGSTKLSLADLEMLKVIADKIKTPDVLTKPYLELMGENEMENNTEVVKSEGNNSAVVTHSDLNLIKDYSGFAKDKNVSFAKFKALMTRKTCEVTKTVLTSSGFKGRTFITKDGSTNFTDANIMVVARFVSGVVQAGLTETELNKVINFIK
jgi:hypothetical protein